MSLSILNNVSSLIAENSLNQTAAAQQKTLQQLSTGLKINSSADDAAGLSMASGMQANTAALAQSSINANNGISFLQVADGALSQVTTLLNRAVTLATESASAGLTSQQRTATDTEYQSILTEINQIGATTQFNGTQIFNSASSSAVSLSNNGATITGAINPADTLTGGFNVTSTIPGVAGAESGITLNDAGGTSTSGTVTSGATLSGNITVTSNTPEVDGIAEQLTFAASPDSSTITSSPIIAGDTLSGNLDISSSGGNAPDSIGINLGAFQGLASSDSTTATNAANALAANMTTAMGATTGSTYTASISGGVLTIQTSNPATAQLPVEVSFSTLAQQFEVQGSGFYLGASLAGSLTFTSSGGPGTLGNPGGDGSATINFANYLGLTSANSATQSAALTQLGNDLTTSLGAETGTAYTAWFTSGGLLNIESNDTNEIFTVSSSNVTATPILGTQNVNLTNSDFQVYSNSIAPGSTLSGTLKILGTGPGGSATAIIDLGNTSYSGLLSGSSAALTNLQDMLNTDLATTGNGTVYVNSGDPPDIIGFGLSDAGSTIQATLGAGESLAVDGGSSGMQEAIVPAASTPSAISLDGVSTANLQNYLQTQLDSDVGSGVYSVNYAAVSGTLSISLNSGMGVTSFSTSSAADQTVGGSSPVTATVSVSLAGLTSTNLAAQLLSQLNSSASDYTASYDQTTGALSIGISAAGNTAGITSIASSNNTAQQTASGGTSGSSVMDVFTSDGTTGGSTNLNVTVGSLTTASLGTSNGNAGADMTGSALLTQSGSTAALALITTAINDISSQRGAVGANVNRLTATANDIQAEDTNLTSATNSIMNADIGKTVANMTQYNILQSTGMAALQQSNQAQQAVLKLVQ
jgi:flagellin